MRSGDYKLLVTNLVPGTMFVRQPNLVVVVLYVIQTDIYIEDEILSNTYSFNFRVGYLIYDKRCLTELGINPVSVNELTYRSQGFERVTSHYCPLDDGTFNTQKSL